MNVRLATSTCLLLTLFADARPARAGEISYAPQLRCLDADAARLLARAVALSPSVRSLVSKIEQSDLVVYIRMDDRLTRYWGATTFMAAAAGLRYVMVGLTPRAYDDDLVAMLGHELQHVVEIADATNVRDVAALETLYRRIGWAGAFGNEYETAAAVDIGRQVAREVTRAPRTLSK